MALLTPFNELPIPAPLQLAIANRGYETATPVQSAVCAAGLADRDLVVTAQTGSGKTLAFGVLAAQALLKDIESADGAPPARRQAPAALIIAPTRELAAQVGRELAWLLAETRLRVVAFTGGTNVGKDLQALQRGVDIVVGTPGRLVDLQSRKALVLGDIEILVVDEADEMLDLGFKEDLETLLGASPAARRTLLFSATIPPEIEQLARQYMRDPERVDVRPAAGRAGSGVQAHEDITHVAHLVLPRDKLGAVVNVLMAAGDAKAIVFCRTREGVGRLHEALVERGLRATAIAGDRAQGERDRALEAVRTSRMQVLVATNVAARGLDLPDLELVIHADLPDSGDALTHRSGRTGRAGQKGTSVIIATPTERRKAERLAAAAGIRIAWTSAPTAQAVRARQEERWIAGVLEDARNLEGLFAEPGPAGSGESAVAAHDASTDPDNEAPDAGSPDAPAAAAAAASPDAPAPAAAPTVPPADPGAIASHDPTILRLADRLRSALPDGVLLSVLLQRELAELPTGMRVEQMPTDSPRVRPDRVDEAPRPSFANAATFSINLGADVRAEPGWLLPLICRRGDITRREVGAIRVGRTSSTFDIAAEAAEAFARAAAVTDPRAPNVRIERVRTPAAGAESAPRPRPSFGNAPRMAARSSRAPLSGHPKAHRPGAAPRPARARPS